MSNGMNRIDGAVSSALEATAKEYRPFFSVLIPCYNVEEYVEECIGSVVKQTFTSWEIIAVNDGSTDTTGAILDSLAAKYGEKLSLVHTVNQGLLLARREAVRRARGSYIVCLDSDDALRHDALEIIASAAAQYPGSIIQFKFSRDPSFCCASGPCYPDSVDNNRVVNIACYRRLVCASNSFNNLCGKGIPRDTVNFDEDYSEYKEVRNGEDLFQLIPILDKAESVVLLNDILYFYRVNEKSITHMFQPGFYDSIRTVGSLLCSYAEKWGDPVCAQLVKPRWMKSVLGAIVSLSNSGYPVGRIKDELVKYGTDELFFRSCSADLAAFPSKERAVLHLLKHRRYWPLALCVWLYGKMTK